MWHPLVIMMMVSHAAALIWSLSDKMKLTTGRSGTSALFWSIVCRGLETAVPAAATTVSYRYRHVICVIIYARVEQTRQDQSLR